MTQLVTNTTNLEKLRKEFSNAKSEILLCSAWITSGTLKRVLTKPLQNKIKQSKLKLRVLIRLGDKMDVKITDKWVFKLIEDLGTNAELRYHKTLHAKMFTVDNSWAMLGSFNLTGGGFGDKDQPGSNPESGFEFRDAAAVKEVKTRFEEIWNDPETRDIPRSLMGFVMSPSNSSEFQMIGIRELPMDKFIQIKLEKSEEEEYLIGKVVNSEKYDFDYFEADMNITDYGKLRDIKEAFGKEDLGGTASAIAAVPKNPQQIRVAKVKVTNKVKLVKGKLALAGGLTFSSTPPDVAMEVHEADKKLLEQIFNQENFAPATLFSNPGIDAGFDPEELCTKHFSVFGSTGSGKSYFVKYLLSNDLYNWYCKKQKGRIIIFDPHDEYREGKDMPSAFVKDKQKFETIDATKYNARLVRDMDDLEEAIGLKFSKREEKTNVDKILTKAVRGKWTNKQFVEELKKESRQVATGSKINLDKELKVLVKEVDNSFYAYLGELKDIANKIVDHELAEGIKTIDGLKADYDTGSATEAKSQYILDKLKSLYGKLSPKVQKTLKQQVIHKNVYKKIEGYFETDIPLISKETIEIIEDAIKSQEITIEQLDLVNKMNKPKIYRINLAGIFEEDIRHKLTASILTQIFNSKKEHKLKEMNTLFVVEEAHNFAPEGAGKNNPSARILQKLAAEGRKFNLGLFIITQRPAHVSKGILSQCSTQAIFRLININDLNQVKEVVEGVSESEVGMLPQFETGQAIFSGVAIRQPVIVKCKKI